MAVATSGAVATTGAWAPFLGESPVAPTIHAGLELPVPAEAAVQARTAWAVSAVPGETVVGAAAGARAVAIRRAITATLAAVRRTAAAVGLTVPAALVVGGVSVGRDASPGPAGTARRARVASRAVTFLTRVAAGSGSTGSGSEEPAATPARPGRPARRLRLAGGAIAGPATVTGRLSRAPHAVMLAVTVGSALTAGPGRPVGRPYVRTAGRAVVRLAGVAVRRPAARAQSVAVARIWPVLRLVVATPARQGCGGSAGPLRPVRRARARRVRRHATSAHVWPDRAAIVLGIRAVAGGLPVRRPVAALVTARRVLSGRSAAGGPIAGWPTIKGPFWSITAGRPVAWLTAGGGLAVPGRRLRPVAALPGRPELAAGRRSARVPDRAVFLAGSGTALAAPRLSGRWLIGPRPVTGDVALTRHQPEGRRRWLLPALLRLRIAPDLARRLGIVPDLAGHLRFDGRHLDGFRIDRARQDRASRFLIRPVVLRRSVLPRSVLPRSELGRPDGAMART